MTFDIYKEDMKRSINQTAFIFYPVVVVYGPDCLAFLRNGWKQKYILSNKTGS